MPPHKALKKDVKKLQPKHRSSPKTPRRPDSQPLALQFPPTTARSSPIPHSTQQALLENYVRAFPDLLSSIAVVEEMLSPLLQEVKGHLFRRDFAAAFGRREYLEAYAVRWSASRSLGYLDIFRDVLERLHEAVQQGDSDRLVEAISPLPTKITCLGGGAGAELCAFAGILHAANAPSSASQQQTTTPTNFSLHITLLDMADWSDVTHALHTTLTTPPPLSAYASASSKASNTPFTPASNLTTTFHRLDVLTPSTPEASALLTQALANSELITLMFTLNELYSTSLPKTQKLLLEITEVARKGVLLLVVDSPGSYSTVSLNGREKKYPMAWLLDHTLLSVAGKTGAAAGKEEVAEVVEEEVERESIVDEDGQEGDAEVEDGEGARGKQEVEQERNLAPRLREEEHSTNPTPNPTAHQGTPTPIANPTPSKSKQDPTAAWQKLTSEPSLWFRLPSSPEKGKGSLKYPLELENMRYQMHLYRRV